MNAIARTTRRHFLKSSLIVAGVVLGGPQTIRAETLGNASKDAANSLSHHSDKTLNQ